MGIHYLRQLTNNPLEYHHHQTVCTTVTYIEKLNVFTSAILGNGIMMLSTIGIVTHLAFFIRGEWHKSLSSLQILLHNSIFKYIPRYIADRCNSPPSYFLMVICFINICCLSVYQYSGLSPLFHRFCGFPGPWLAKCTKPWHVAKVLDSKNHVLLSQPREQNGDFVRTGLIFAKTFKSHQYG